MSPLDFRDASGKRGTSESSLPYCTFACFQPSISLYYEEITSLLHSIREDKQLNLGLRLVQLIKGSKVSRKRQRLIVFTRIWKRLWHLIRWCWGAKGRGMIILTKGWCLTALTLLCVIARKSTTALEAHDRIFSNIDWCYYYLITQLKNKRCFEC